MYEPSQIIISSVANGWLVRLPQTNFTPLIDPDEAIRHQARIMKEEMLGDDVLSKLKNSNNILNDAPQHQPSFRLAKDNELHVFKEFTEVLGFLKFIITEDETR